VTTAGAPLRGVGPLYLAGFTTAFGAHGVAAALGARSDDIGLGLLGFGVVLALYDIAEVLLKPVFGALSDRVGVKPVIVGGLLAFTAVSLLGTVTVAPVAVALVRLGQGAAASAFSPASSAAVARLSGAEATGRYFGRYGSWKSLGYAGGPLLGAVLLPAGGLPAVFAALALLGLIAAGWAYVRVPGLPVLPRPRYTVADLVRQVTERGFVMPTLVLAASTGAFGVLVGFLPRLAGDLGLGTLGSMAAVTVLALATSAVQPVAGRWGDAGRLSTRTGTTAGLLAVAAGAVVVALAPGAVTVYLAALLAGVGIGTVTPLAFAHLAAVTPAERLGRTMGNAELGRELGDAGGPLLVGAVASAATLPVALGVMAALAVVVAGTGAVVLRPVPRAAGAAPRAGRAATAA